MRKPLEGQQLNAQVHVTTTDDAEKEVVDLMKGWPDPALLPRDIIAGSLARVSHNLSQGDTLGLPYGTPQIYTVELVNFLNRQLLVDEGCELPARVDSLMINDGVSRGLDLVCHLFSKPGEAVMVEAPTYKNARLIFQEHGLEIIPIGTDAHGILVADVEAQLEARSKNFPHAPPVRFIYTIPTNNNPTGTTLPTERRRALVELARKHNALILADEVYHLLDWHDAHERPQRMVCFDEAFTLRHGGSEAMLPAVISISSFTKICAPGLRLGWFEAAPSILRKLSSAAYMMSGGNAGLMALILAEAMRIHAVDRAISEYCTAYRARARVIVDMLEAAGLPPLVRPCGGFFVWVPLPVQAEAVLKEVQSVKFMSGEFCDTSNEGRRCVRLCFAYNSEKDLTIGVKRFVQGVRNAQKRKPGFTASRM